MYIVKKKGLLLETSTQPLLDKPQVHQEIGKSNALNRYTIWSSNVSSC